MFLVLNTLPILAQTDTLNYFFNFNATDLISSPNGGYISGNNGYGDKEKLQVFIPDTNYSVLGAIVWLGAIDRSAVNTSNSRVWLKMRRFDVSPVANIPFVAGPKEVLDSASFSLDSLQADSTYENGWNFLPFNTPVFAGQPYGISLSFENLEPGDTSAIRHSVLDSVLSAGNSWEIWNGSWRRIIDNWGVNVDLAIFPVIDSTLNFVPHGKYVISSLLFPNPGNSPTIKLDSSKEFDTLLIMDMFGRIKHISELQVGIDSATLSFPFFSNGLYTIILSGQKYSELHIWNKCN